LILAPPLSLSQLGYAIVLLYVVCFVGSLYLGFWVWNHGHVTLAKAEHCLFVSFFGLQVAGLQDSGMCAATGNDCDCRKAIVLGFCI